MLTGSKQETERSKAQYSKRIHNLKTIRQESFFEKINLKTITKENPPGWTLQEENISRIDKKQF
jgi:hypothetical protein